MEVNLENVSRNSGGSVDSKTVFKGIVFEIACPVQMPKIVFLRVRGRLTSLTEKVSPARRNLERLEFPDADVEKVYSVYTDDIAAAQQKMTPEFGRTLLNISRQQQGKDRYLAAAFDSERLFLVLELHHDFMNIGSFDSSPDEFEENLHQALADLMIPRRIIDQLVAG